MLKNCTGLDSGDVSSNEQLAPIDLKRSPAWGWSLLSGKHFVVDPRHCEEGEENGLQKNCWSKDEGVGVAEGDILGEQ